MRWCLLLSSIVVVSLAANNVRNAADKPSSALMTVLSMDCTGVVRWMPDSLLSAAGELPGYHRGFNKLIDRVKQRVACKCPSYTGATFEDMFRARYSPVDMILNFINPNRQYSHVSCLDTFGPGYTRDIYKVLNYTFGSTSIQTPSTCTWDTFKGSEGCRFRVPLTTSDIDLQFVVKRCPSTDVYTPYFALHCSGGGCNILHPCNIDADCGSSTLQCQDIFNFADVEEDIFKTFRDTFKFYGKDQTLEGVSGMGCPTPSALVNGFIKKLHRFFPGGPANPGKLCLPRTDDDDDDDAGKVIENRLENEGDKWEVTEKKDVAMCHRHCASGSMYCYTQTHSTINLNITSSPGQEVFKSWDGTLANGRSAVATNRLDGTVYTALPAPTTHSGESHVGGLDCNGVLSFLRDTAMGMSFQIQHAHEALHDLATELYKTWQCRGQPLSAFRLNEVLWQPDWLLYGLLSHPLTYDLDWGPLPSLAREIFGDKVGNNAMAALQRLAGRRPTKMGPQHIATAWSHMVNAARGAKEYLTPTNVMRWPGFIDTMKEHLSKAMKATTHALQHPHHVLKGGQPELTRAGHRVVTQSASGSSSSSAEEDDNGDPRVQAVPTCNFNVWTQTGTCNAQYTTSWIFGGSGSGRIRIERCGTSKIEALPGIQASCHGDNCPSKIQSCIPDGATCPSSQTCQDIVSELDENAYMHDWMGALLWGGFHSGSLGYLNGPDRDTFACIWRETSIVKEPVNVPTCSSVERWKNDILQTYAAANQDQAAAGMTNKRLKVCMMNFTKVEDNIERASDADEIVKTTTVTVQGKEYTVHSLQHLQSLDSIGIQQGTVTLTAKGDLSTANLQAAKATIAQLTGVPISDITIVSADGVVTMTMKGVKNPVGVAEGLQQSSEVLKQLGLTELQVRGVPEEPDATPPTSGAPSLSVPLLVWFFTVVLLSMYCWV